MWLWGYRLRDMKKYISLAIVLAFALQIVPTNAEAAVKPVTAKILQQYVANSESMCREIAIYLVARGADGCRTKFTFTPAGPATTTPIVKTLYGAERSAALQLFGEKPAGVCEVRKVVLVPTGTFNPTTGVGSTKYVVHSKGQTVTAKRDVIACKG